MKKINWKYALGEIVIVIIGITIAFWLNSWKEDSKDDALRLQYLENIRIDIDKEIDHINENDILIQTKLGLIREIKPFLGKGNKKNRRSVIQKFFSVAQLISFQPENTTYTTLINSGDMNLIKNFDLRRKIVDHYRQHEIILQNYKRLEKIHEKYLADLFVYDIDFKEIRKGNFDFFDKPLLGSVITSIEGTYFMIVQANKKCLEDNQNLLKEINQVLNNDSNKN